MLNAIIAFSLNNRAAVAALALVIGALGLYRAVSMPIDVLPDMNRPVVTVMTESHGMIPEDIERQVTWPIEQVMNGATGVFRVRSASGMGLSVVYVEFDWGTDVYRNRQIVAEKLQTAVPQLPPGVQPVLAPVSSIMGQVQLVGFQSPSGETDELELRRIVDRDVRPRILSLGGVAQVVVIGGEPTELQALVDADKLRAFGVTVEEVARAMERANVNVSGSFIERGPMGPLVSVPGRVQGPDDLAAAVVREDPVRPVRLADVAEVRFGPAQVKTGGAGINGSPGVILVVQKQPGVDTVALTERVDEELRRLATELPGDVVIQGDLFQQAAFIHRAIDNVLEAVVLGGVLVLIVLFAFLLNLRTTFITLTAIPLSVAISALVFSAFGLTINTMTLGGLAVAIGTLVDDAIVDVENVYRRLHENARSEAPRPILPVLFQASSEIRRPVLYGTLLVTVVYLPLFFLSGIEGRLFAPIGLAYITSVFASLLVALTVTPVLCYYLLGRMPVRGEEYGSLLVRRLRGEAARVVRWSIAWTGTWTGLAAGFALLGGVLLSVSGTAFLPAFNEGSAQVNLYLPPDVSLATSEDFGRRLERVVLDVEGVSAVARRTGRAEGDEHAMPVSVTEAMVTFDDEAQQKREEILEEIRDRIEAEFPGVATATEQPLAHLLSHLLSGVTAQVAIKVRGPSLDELREIAAEVEAAVAPVDGVRDLFTEPQVLVDQVEVAPRREQLARLGLDVAQVAETVELAMGGEKVSVLQQGQLAIPITLSLVKEDRADLQSLAGLYLRGTGDELVRLGDVADVRMSRTSNNINRENAQRQIVVQHNVGGRSLGEVVADVERALESVRAGLEGRPGYSIRVSGQFEAQQEATRLISLLSLFSVVFMVVILFMHFQSMKLALLVLLTRPLALTGAAAWVFLTGQVLSVATLVGFIALLGISARNAILLVDHSLRLNRVEGVPWSEELLVRAGAERVVPVLMTALTSGIGLLPLAWAADQPGRELLYPVATVILGGLVTSTLLDFFVLPGLLWRIGRVDPDARRVERLEARDLEEALV